MRRRWRLGLRTRTTAAFALSGLLLSLALSALTYQLARQSFTRQRREAAVSRALQRARSAQASLQVLGVDPVDVVDQLKPGANESFVIEVDGTPFASGPEDDRVPKGVRRLVGQGQAARQLFRDKKGPGLAMGFPLSRDGKAYYEVASLADTKTSQGIVLISQKPETGKSVVENHLKKTNPKFRGCKHCLHYQYLCGDNCEGRSGDWC